MDKIQRLYFAESAVFYALLKRIQNVVPDRADTICKELLKRSWGKQLVDSWSENDHFVPIWNALEENIDYGCTPLRSIFSKLSIDDMVPKSETYYKPEQWQEPVNNPEYTKPSSKDVQFYWEGISESWKQWIRDSSSNPEIRLTSFFEWSERWLSSVPVSKRLDAICLADHLKLMAAIASACFKQNSFQIIMGDVSGIQSYLFDISHIGAGKVAKRLRARSFILGLLSDAAAHKLLLQNDMPIVNLVLSAGGIFYAIVPERALISQWKNEINAFFYQRYHGSIALHCAARKVKLQELADMQDHHIISDLHQKIQASKGQPFINVLQQNGKWNDQNFLHKQNTDIDPCKSCQRFPRKTATEDLCEFCQLDEKVGRLLPNTKYLIFKKQNGLITLFSDICVDLASDIKGDVSGQAYLIQGWNDADLQHKDLPVQRKWVANYVPTAPEGGCKHCLDTEESEPVAEGEPLTFKCIAQFSKGKPLLGYLKADVDHLGMLLSIGFKSDRHDEIYTLAQLPALSRLLERFFAGGINKWLYNEYPHIYTVFSGGDDLYLVGPWNDMIDAAIDFRMHFQKYTGYNPDITLSAGISIVKPTSPVAHVSAEVEQQLERAKEKPNLVRRNKDPQANGRNQITIRRQTMEWTDLLRVKEQAKMLSQWYEQQKISSSFLHYLRQLSKLYEEYRDGESKVPKFVPLLSYYINRNLEENRQSKKKEDVIEWSKKLLLIDDPETYWKWGYMKTIVELAHLYRNEKGDH